jgi:predicted Zn-dependent protease with MMP-like domain
MTAAAWRDAAAPSLDDFAALARAAFAALPGKFRRLAEDVVLRIDDFPDDEVLEELGLEDPFELTGLYQGVDLARRSVLDPSPAPARVFLYRRAILDEFRPLRRRHRGDRGGGGLTPGHDGPGGLSAAVVAGSALRRGRRVAP